MLRRVSAFTLGIPNLDIPAMHPTMPKIGPARFSNHGSIMKSGIVITALLLLGGCCPSDGELEKCHGAHVLQRLAHVEKYEGYYVGDDPRKSEGGLLFAQAAASATLTPDDIVEALKSNPSNAGVFYLLIMLYYKDKGVYEQYKHLARGVKAEYSVYDLGHEEDFATFEASLKSGTLLRQMQWRRVGDL